jgi:hypothetical protein
MVTLTSSGRTTWPAELFPRNTSPAASIGPGGRPGIRTAECAPTIAPMVIATARGFLPTAIAGEDLLPCAAASLEDLHEPPRQTISPHNSTFQASRAC